MVVCPYDPVMGVFREQPCSCLKVMVSICTKIRFVFRFVQNIGDQVLSKEFLFVILTLNCMQVTYYFYTRVVTLQLLTFTVNVCCLITNMLSFFCTCGLDSSLDVGD